MPESLVVDKETKQRALTHVRKLFNAARINRRRYDNVFENINRAYWDFTAEMASYRRSKTKLPKQVVRSNISIPIAFSEVEQTTGRLMLSVFSVRPYIVALPRGPDDVDKAKRATNLLDWHSQRDRIFTKYLAIIKQMVMYGTSIFKVAWEYGQQQWANQLVADEATITPVSIFNFYPDPLATSADDMRFAIETAQYDFNWVMNMVDQGFYAVSDDELDALVKLRSEILDRQKQVSGLDSAFFEAGRGGIASSLMSGEPLLNVVEYAGPFELEEGKLPVQCLITIIEDKLVVRITDNPYGFIPYVVVRDVPVPGEFYGIGEIEPIIPVQEAMSSIVNLRIDNVNLSVNRMWKVVRNSGIDTSQIFSHPGGIISVRSHDDIQPLISQDVAQSSYLETNELRNLARETLGSFPPIVGQPVSKRQTGFEVATLAEMGGLRYRIKARNIEEEAIVPHARMVLELYSKFMEKPRLVRILGPDGIEFHEVGREDLDTEFDLIPVGSASEPVANKGFRQQQLLQVWQMLVQDPTINRKELNRMILDIFDVKNAEEILNPPPEAQMQGLQNLLQARQAQGQISPEDIVRLATSRAQA